MTPVGFEPTIAADEGPKIYALDRAATGPGYRRIYETKFPTHVSLLFSFFCLSCHQKFSCDAQNVRFVVDCGHMITLPVCCYLQQ